MPATLQPKDRILVALDVAKIEDAAAAVRDLSGLVGGFKVGLELLCAEGSRAVIERIHGLGGRVFYDGKFHDIPNTVAAATRAVARLGVWMLNVHASAGADAMRACAGSRGGALAVAVTVLTALDDAACLRIYGQPAAEQVMRFAREAASCGLDGVVCSPRELPLIGADAALRELISVVPGVRPAWAPADDQARTLTPAEAVRAGACYLVLGRPILRPPAWAGSRQDAARRVADEIAEALAGQA